jgi:hypothetical protein
MKRIYYESKWTRAQLNGKTIQFVLTFPKCWVEGIGTLRVHVYRKKVSIDIDVPCQGDCRYNLHHIYDPALADKIEPHPDTSVADFRLLA